MKADTDKKYCSILFDIFEQHGIKDIVCSPGSRNVPLLLAASARDSFKKHFCVDERSAAFMALGIALVSQKPVVLICTSGTALLDYSPAIAEAYYQGIPLIVISADRPIQWIDQDDSQTLRQDNAINNFVKKSFSIPADINEEDELLWYVNRVSNEACILAKQDKAGPVHLNVHIGEPLGKTAECRPNTQRIIHNLRADTIGNKEVIKELAHKFANSKVCIIAGFMQPDSALQKALSQFCKLSNVVVFAETISNIHLNSSEYIVDSVLTAYETDELDKCSPDLIISIGGALVSRKLKEFLRRHAGKGENWSVGFSNLLSDPFMSLSLKLEVDPVRFFRNLYASVRKFKISEAADKYAEKWKSLRENAISLKNNFIENAEWSEIKAFDIVLNSIPSTYNLFLSNGTPVRYAQIIRYPLPHASYCNRGVSGIDGSVSTAVGGAIAYKGKTLLITGDLSFMYDMGALTQHEIPDRFKIIVIDNQGGGIFRFIPSTKDLSIREEYLCMNPRLPVENMAESFGCKYFEADNTKNLKEILPSFFSSEQKSILKISCDGELSAEILKNYMTIKVK